MAEKAKRSNSVDWLDEPDPAPVAEVEKTVPGAEGWRDMGEIGADETSGRPVVLTGQNQTQVCVWRVSRRFVPGPDGRGGRFEPVGFWALRNSGGQRIQFEPTAWRPYTEADFYPKRA